MLVKLPLLLLLLEMFTYVTCFILMLILVFTMATNTFFFHVRKKNTRKLMSFNHNKDIVKQNHKNLHFNKLKNFLKNVEEVNHPHIQ